VNGFIRLLARYGFSDLRVIALHNGMVSGIRDATNRIASSHLLKRIVLKFK